MACAPDFSGLFPGMAEDAGRGRAALAATIGAALIGLSPIAVRLSEVGPQATNFWRFVFALPILAIWAGLARPIPTTRQTWLLLFAGVLFACEVGLWAAALGHTTVTNATLLANLTPVFAAAFGWLLFKERLSRGVLAGGAVALSGAVILAMARASASAGPAHSVEEGWLGDALGFSAAIGYAGYLLIVRAVGKSVSVGAVMFWATLSAALTSGALGLMLHETMLPHSAHGWAMLVGLGVIVQVGGQGLIAYGVGRLPIAMSTVLLWMQPLVAAGLSWMLFGEALGPLAFVGAALVLAGVYVVQRSRQ
jgi:drug/metabolite transporter (DMT)-like permease